MLNMLECVSQKLSTDEWNSGEVLQVRGNFVRFLKDLFQIEKRRDLPVENLRGREPKFRGGKAKVQTTSIEAQGTAAG